MKKTAILVLTLVLVMAASTFASAANYIGAGLGIVGAGEPKPLAGPYIASFAADFDAMDKLTLSANGYLEVIVPPAGDPGAAALSDVKYGYMAGAYAKYAVLDLNGLAIGPVAGINYNNNFAPKVDPAPEKGELKYGAGVFATQALGETGTIYAQAMYWMPKAEAASFTDAIGGLGGINFRLTDKIAVKGQVEYINKHTLFSIGAGYTF